MRQKQWKHWVFAATQNKKRAPTEAVRGATFPEVGCCCLLGGCKEIAEVLAGVLNKLCQCIPIALSDATNPSTST